jgi:hypothetical protein
MVGWNGPGAMGRDADVCGDSAANAIKGSTDKNRRVGLDFIGIKKRYRQV